MGRWRSCGRCWGRLVLYGLVRPSARRSVAVRLPAAPRIPAPVCGPFAASVALGVLGSLRLRS